MRPGWKWVAAMAVLVLGIVVSVSGAATSGSKRDGGSGAGSSSSRDQRQWRAPIPAPAEHLSTLADELGVSQDKLREALAAVREDLAPPRPPRLGQRPSRAQLERRCNQFTDALAQELGKTGDEVRAAMKSAARKGIEEAVDAGHLTRSQADRILSRVDDAPCAPGFGIHAKRGCGPRGPGGRFERPAAPPEPGSEGTSIVIPAPMGAPA